MDFSDQIFLFSENMAPHRRRRRHTGAKRVQVAPQKTHQTSSSEMDKKISPFTFWEEIQAMEARKKAQKDKQDGEKVQQQAEKVQPQAEKVQESEK